MALPAPSFSALPSYLTTPPRAGNGGTIYAGGTATYLPNKNEFYKLLGQVKDPSVASEFYNNPFGVSAQEINGIIGGVGQPQYPGYIDTSSGGSGGGGVSAGTLASYDQSIGNTNSAISRLGGQLTSGYSLIDAQTKDALDKLLLNRNRAQSTYDTTTLQNKNDYVSGKNTIATNAGATLGGLLRLLGSRGAGGSSAAKISAPGAVAREATIQRNELGTTFGKNSQALDTNWNNFLTDYGNQVSDVNNQKTQSRKGLEDSINNQKATLLQNLAQLTAQKAAVSGGNPAAASQPFLNQANSILDQLSNYSVAPVNYKVNSYTAPELSKYTTNPNAAPTVQGTPATNDYTNPYLAGIGRKLKVAG